jgi:predicted nicotinamide N-methyase
MTKTSISLEIPDGAEPGDILTFVILGSELEIPVPQGALPGDVLEVQVGAASVEQDLHESYVTIPLPCDFSLRFESTIPNDSNFVIAGNGSDGTHALAWPAGIFLAEYLTSNATTLSMPPDCSVLELGSGLGVAGMTFGHMYRESLKELVLTDHPSAIHLLEYNVSQNTALLPSSVTVRPLEWDIRRQEGCGNHQWMLGSDLFYNTKSIPNLVSMVELYLLPLGCILVSIRWRKPDLEREFFEKTSRGSRHIQWELLAGQSNTGWENYGTSNDSHFIRNMVGVQGQPKALALILETDTARMSKEEYDAWDRAQIQIYVGRCST